MFKFMKQGISLAAAAAAAGSCIPVYAAGIQPRTSVMAPDGTEDKGTSITIAEPVEGHRYKVYQVFKGRVSSDGTKLSNVEYGANYSGREGVTLADDLAQLEAEGAEAKAFAEIVKGFLTGEPAAVLSAESPTAELEAGYYLVMDESDGGAGDALSDYIVTVAGNVTVQPKSVSVPEFDKSIDDWKDGNGDVTENPDEENTTNVSTEDIKNGEVYNLYQMFTRENDSNGTITKLRYGLNYGVKGQEVLGVSVPLPESEQFGEFMDSIKGEISGEPIGVLTKEKPSINLESGYYLVEKMDENGDSAGWKSLNINININNIIINFPQEEQPTEPKPMDLSPQVADINWDYTIDEQAGTITLDKYIGSKTDIKVYSHYKLQDYDGMWRAVLSSNETLDASKGIFFRSNVEKVTFSDSLDVSNCTGVNYIFGSCTKLKNVNFGSAFESNNIKKTYGMFDGCTALEILDLSRFDTSNLILANFMFRNCSSLNTIDMSNFKTNNVTNMNHMFDGCAALEILDLSGFCTENVEEMVSMFEGCSNLVSINLTGFNTSSVKTMKSMFSGCSSIQEINLQSFDTSQTRYMDTMFANCTALETLNLENFDTGMIVSMVGMFFNDSAIHKITATEGRWTTEHLKPEKINNMFYNCGVNNVTLVNPVTSAVSAILPLSYASDNTGDVQSEEFIDIEGEDTSVEYGIGDSIPYKLTATMPESITAYNKYVLAFHDRLSAGLDYDRDSLKVFAGDTEIPAEHYTVTYSEDGKSMTVSIADVKAAPWNAVPGTQIIVKYSAMLNENAQAGNTNEAFLEYSNDPKGDGTGTTGPGVPDIVTVYTFELRFDKVDKNGNALEGAGFTLYKKNDAGEFVPAGDEIKGLTRFSFKGLAAGEYKLVETTTPDGYNTMEDLYFNIVAEETESGGETVKRISIEAPDGSPLSGWTAIGADKAFESDIANYTGSTLPETGGAGTYLLYAAGVAVVITAGTVIAARKKADEE